MSLWYAFWDLLPFEMLHWDFMCNAFIAVLHHFIPFDFLDMAIDAGDHIGKLFKTIHDGLPFSIDGGAEAYIEGGGNLRRGYS